MTKYGQIYTVSTASLPILMTVPYHQLKMAKLRQAVEQNLRQIEKLRYLNAFVTEADDYARKLLEESAQRHAEGALLTNE